MGRCAVCGAEKVLIYTCNYCNREHCSTHRLPEAHGCVGAAVGRSHGSPDFRTGPGSRDRREIGQTAEDEAASADGDQPTPTDLDDEKGNRGEEDSHRTRSPLSSLYGVGQAVMMGLRRALSIPSQLARELWFQGRLALRRWWPVLAVMLVGLLVVSATVGTGITPLDNGVAAGVAVGGAVWNESVGELAGANGGDGLLGPEELNATHVERLVHAEVNDRRRARGLPALSYSVALSQVAAYHSRDMATEGYVAHEAPDGETVSDRYAAHGVPCGAEAENILYTYYGTDMNTDRGLVRYSSQRELASGAVASWMNSSGHRANILNPRLRSEGLGVYTTTTAEGWTAVYITQNFCG